MAKEYTDKEKIRILEKNGYQSEEGYIFPNPTDQDYESHFCSKEEAEEVFKRGSQIYFYNESAVCMQDLETAWDYFIEEYYDNNFEEFGNQEDRMMESLNKFLEN